MVLELRVDKQTIINDVNFEYTIFIDEINKAVISTTGNTNFQRNLLKVGNYIEIYDNGILNFRGKINSSGNIEGNSIKLIIRGEEEEYVKDNCDTDILGTDGLWKNTASSSIATSILNTGINYSAGTIDTGVNIDFRVNNSTSKWNGFVNLANKVGQEKYVDYQNKKINLLNSLGSDNVDILNEGTDFDFLYFQESEAEAKKVIVKGKGDGIFQLTATATAVDYIAGEDNIKSINDPTCVSVDECQELANTTLAKLKNNRKIYSVPITNPYKKYSIGDTLIINGSSYGINDEKVRIVSITKGRKGKNQFLSIEVTNEEYSTTIKSSNQKIAANKVVSNDKSNYMQGSGNTLTYTNSLNCKYNAPLQVVFQLPKKFILDETDAIRVVSMDVDYDVDKYRKEVGSATYEGGDLDVSGSSSSTEPDVENSSSSTEPNVSGSTSSEDAGGSGWSASSVARDSGSGDLSAGSWDTNFLSTSDIDTRDYSMFVVELSLSYNSGDMTYDEVLEWKVQIGGSTQIHDFRSEFGYHTESETIIMNYLIRSDNSSSSDFDVDIRATKNCNISAAISVYGFDKEHNHSDGTLSADNHSHASGTYNAENHPHASGTYEVDSSEVGSIGVGDDVNDASLINATSVDIYLDHWNGSSWDNKHSIINTGKTLDTDVDITNGGVYPDDYGYWRVRINPNSSNPDLIKGIVKLKHNLDD